MLSSSHIFSDDPFFKTKLPRGFTLVEVLLAAGILSILISIILGSVLAVTRTVDDARERIQRLQLVRGFFWRISDELNNCFLGEGMDLIGESKKSSDADEDSLSFMSTARGPRQDEKGLTGIQYFLSRGSLYKSLSGETFAVLDEVSSFNLKYFYDGEWHAGWDSNLEGKLPRVIEINLIHDGEAFSTSVSIPLTKEHEEQ